MDTQPERVTFTEGQVLRTRDLQDEQAYHLEASREHNVSAHSWGIVRGLTLQVRDGLAIVTAGLAIDRVGHVLELTADTPIRNTTLNDNQFRKEAPWGVWLRYAEIDRCRDSQLKQRCPDDPIDPTCDRLRTDETPALIPTRVSKDPPGEQPTDDSRVYLGRLLFDTSLGTWTASPDGRRYVGLVAERVVAPTRPGEPLRCPDDPLDGNGHGTWVQIGTSAKYPNDLFAVRFPRPETEPDVPTPDAWLAVSKLGRVALTGPEVAVAGRLMLENGAAIGFEPVSPAEETKNGQSQLALDSKFWTIYRHYQGTDATKAKGDLLADSLAALDTGLPIPGDELRIAFPREVSTKATAKVVVGSWAEGKFASVLEVQQAENTRTVTVNGNLILTGAYIGPAPVIGGGTVAIPSTTITDPAADPGLNQMLQYWLLEPSVRDKGQVYVGGELWKAPGGPIALGKGATDTTIGDFAVAAAKIHPEPMAKAVLAAPDGPTEIGENSNTVQIAGMIDGLFTRVDGPKDFATALIDPTLTTNPNRLKDFIKAIGEGGAAASPLLILAKEVFASADAKAQQHGVTIAKSLPADDTAEQYTQFAQGLAAHGKLEPLAKAVFTAPDTGVTKRGQLVALQMPPDDSGGQYTAFADGLGSGVRLVNLTTAVFADTTRASVVAQHIPDTKQDAQLNAFAAGLGSGDKSTLWPLAEKLMISRDQAVTIMQRLQGSNPNPASYFTDLTGAIIGHVAVPTAADSKVLFAATDTVNHPDDPARFVRIVADWRALDPTTLRNVWWVGMTDFVYAMANGTDIPDDAAVPAPDGTLALELLGFLRTHTNPHVKNRYALIKACVEKLEETS